MKSFVIPALCLCIFFVACKKDDDPAPSKPPLVTTQTTKVVSQNIPAYFNGIQDSFIYIKTFTEKELAAYVQKHLSNLNFQGDDLNAIDIVFATKDAEVKDSARLLVFSVKGKSVNGDLTGTYNIVATDAANAKVYYAVNIIASGSAIINTLGRGTLTISKHDQQLGVISGSYAVYWLTSLYHTAPYPVDRTYFSGNFENLPVNN